MSDDIAELDPQNMTPQQFAELISGAEDDAIAQGIHAVGTEQTLDRIFQGMEENFRPDKAEGVDAQIQWVVTDEGTENPYLLTIKDKTAAVAKEKADSPKVTLTTDLVSFVKLITGNAQGPQLFMSGKLKIAGDLMFSQRLMTFFDQPSA